MIILAIDPSVSHIGVAVLENETALQYGTINTKGEGATRKREIISKVLKLIQKYKPDVLAIETQYISFGKGFGILETVKMAGLVEATFFLACKVGELVEVTPTEAKKVFGVTGKRKEAKLMTVAKVQEHFNITTKIDDNAADAICIGLAGFYKLRGIPFGTKGKKEKKKK